MKECIMCKLYLPESQFYKRISRGRNELQSYCKKCNTINNRIRYRTRKEKYVEYLGGKCEICGYAKSLAALDFHHLDPTQKDPGFANMQGWSLARGFKELDKCQLVCSNCHREIHDEYIKI